MTDSGIDALGRVAHATEKLGALLLELRDEPDVALRAARLREAGRHLGSLSAECLARAAEEGAAKRAGPVERVMIDARTQA